MAITTSTVQTDRVLAELINEKLGEASKARVTALAHCSHDSIAGDPTFSKAYPRAADDGAAAGATEGTDISTVTTAAMGTQLVLTPTEGAGTRFDLTNQTLSKRNPGMEESALVAAILNGGPGVLTVFAEEFARQTNMAIEAAEVAVMALLDDFSTSVGTTTAVFTLAQAEAAQLALTDKELNKEDQWAFLLAPNQLSNIRNEIGITSGGASGAIWSTDVQSIMSVNPGIVTDGLVGMLFGSPCYQTATSTNPNPNAAADVAGALVVSGGKRHPDDDGGALVFLEGAKPVYGYAYVPNERQTKLVTTYSFAVGERYDDGGISIITDAG